MNQKQKLGKIEFITLLLIYAAHADYIFTEKEERYIKDIADKETYSSMLELFYSQSDFETLRLLLFNRKSFYNNAETKNEIITILKNQFLSDGDKYNIESGFIDFFNKMTETL